ncbi:MAG: ATP-dependent DNA helicase RecG [Clostridiales bacterium]|nr:ATP-dependent DNA helicase RecG [Clostridiales bacterium]
MDKKLLLSIQYLKGVGERRAKLFARLGIETVFDLLTHFPRDYEDRTVIKRISDLTPGESVCIKATVMNTPARRKVRNRLSIARFKVFDESGYLNIVYFNMKYSLSGINPGEIFVFFGKVVDTQGMLEMHNPVFENINEAGHVKTRRIVPVYPLTTGLSQNQVSACVKNALTLYGDGISDPLPDDVRNTHKLSYVRYAYENIHSPASAEAIGIARRRLVFEELLILSAGLLMLKKRRVKQRGIAMEKGDVSVFTDNLPFKLTGAQRRALNEAAADMRKGVPMNRLICGDVGSGKTVVAAALMYLACVNGYQAALMAPTEILAKQHYKSLSKLFGKLYLNVGLLTGGLSAAAKRDIKNGLLSHEINIVIGTHALLSGDVGFDALGLVITDEQHRFGVLQRSALTVKGENPHLLVMSATPIPRTLALILYGDLDISVIDELPPGRRPVDTYAIDGEKRPRAYRFIREQLDAGRQAYIVCPLVEESDKVELASVKEFAEKLSENEFKDYSVALIHGKMKVKEKDAIMREFKNGGVSVLVSTTVIEVGIDVPNASIMMIENAERFGLSQLHQLRGRVGRGEHKSYCILVSDVNEGATRERLHALCRISNGFELSEQDLKLRGPGDFFGTRQHGIPNLKIASFSADLKTLKEAQAAAAEIIERDPGLKSAEHAELSERIKLLFAAEEYGNIFN